MITLLATAAHAYTHAPLQGNPRFELRMLSYNRAFRAKTLPRGTYIFADMDRLGFWELELAARLYRTLKAAGLRVLNDPAHVRQRFSLLRELHHRGLNRFGVWSADDSSRPPRYPVFLRTQSAHRGPLSDLLHDEDAVQAAIARTTARGIPLRELMLVEYCAEPIAGDLFRKLATFRVGDRLVSTLCVHERHWAAKYGENGVATPQMYDDEYAIVAENRWGEPLRAAFDAASTEYGRADFALVGGTPQVYEINTNPMLGRIEEHPMPIRVQADALFFEHLADAFAHIDSPSTGKPVSLDDEALDAQRRRDKLVLRSRWLP